MVIGYVDGVPHRLLPVESFDIYPGQRYSVFVTADQPIGNYWIRATAGEAGVPGHVRGNPNFDSDLRGVLRYEGAPLVEPPLDGSAEGVSGLGHFDVRDLSVYTLPDPRLMGNTPPDLVFDMKFREDRNGITEAVEWRINDIAVRHSRQTHKQASRQAGSCSRRGAHVLLLRRSAHLCCEYSMCAHLHVCLFQFRADEEDPTLLRVLRGATFRPDFPRFMNPQVILQPNAVVDIRISGGAGGFRHPIHLHGHDFATISEKRRDEQVPSLVRNTRADRDDRVEWGHERHSCQPVLCVLPECSRPVVLLRMCVLLA
jgi:FtsP/CotA-like multicopper oxidase with cupredoxin domain